MQLILSFFRLFRLTNILIIVLAQVMLRYCVIQPYLFGGEAALLSPGLDFSLLVLATALLAMGGYVINDYFDVKIDSVNRPESQVVNRSVSPRMAILLHIIMNVIAIVLGFYLAWKISAFSFGFIFPFISGLLWIYSARYKRVTFWGNFIVSALTAFVILIVWLYEFFWIQSNPELFAEYFPRMRNVTMVFLGYGLFAFLTSMVREIIKDMEDYEGDRKFDCATIPVVLGLRTSRFLVAGIVFLTMLLLGWAQLILYRMGMMLSFWYFMLTVQFFAAYMMVRLLLPADKHDFHLLSIISKVVMVAGILSMEILLINN